MEEGDSPHRPLARLPPRPPRVEPATRPPRRPAPKPGPSAPAAGDAGMFGPCLAFRTRSLYVLAAAAALAGHSAAAVPVPGREPVRAVDFERHVMGLFSK